MRGEGCADEQCRTKKIAKHHYTQDNAILSSNSSSSICRPSDANGGVAARSRKAVAENSAVVNETKIVLIGVQMCCELLKSSLTVRYM